jgi:hypothetical protein
MKKTFLLFAILLLSLEGFSYKHFQSICEGDSIEIGFKAMPSSMIGIGNTTISWKTPGGGGGG